MSVSSGRGPRWLMILVSSAVPLSDAITLVHLGPAHCSSNLCQGGSSSPRTSSAATSLSHPPVLPPFLFLFLPLFARRALNYGGNATKSSGLIELLLESRRGVRLTKKGKEKKGRKKTRFLLLAPPLHARLCPALARGNDFSSARISGK